MMNKLFQILIFIFIIILPWQTRWIFFDYQLAGLTWEYGRLSLYASWLILIVAALVFLIKHPREWHWSKQWLSYLFIFYFLLSLFWSPIPAITSYYLVLLFSAVLVIFLLRKAKISFSLAFILAGFIQASLAIWQFFQQQVVANKWLGLAQHNPVDLGTSVIEIGDQRWLRAYGALPHPNMLGGFLTLTIIFSLIAWWQFYHQGDHEHWSKKFIKDSWWRLGLLMVMIVIQSVGLALAFSRSAVLGLSLAWVILLILALKDKQVLLLNVLIKYLVILLLVFGITNWYLPGSWQQRFLAQGRLENISKQERVASFKQINWTNPKEIILGQGMSVNSYQAWAKQPHKKPYDFQPIHNVYLLLLAEVGIVGILMMLFLAWRHFYKKYKLDYLSLALLVAVLTMAMFDHYFWTSWLGLCLLALVFTSLKPRLKV